MKRYIRTKDGKIFERKSRVNKTFYYENRTYTSYYCTIVNDSSLEKFLNQFGGIAKQANTIEGLIEVGDLVRLSEDYSLTNNKGMVEVNACMLVLFEDGDITELYTKQVRNYVLAWTKEEGVI